MKEYKRICPKCGNMLIYSNRQNLWAANKKNSLCHTCGRPDMAGSNNPFFGKTHSESTRQKLSKASKQRPITDEFRQKMSEVTSGKNNPNYGKSNYERWIEKYGFEEANRRNDVFKAKLSEQMSGEGNPMYGKPSPQGSGNGWSGWYGEHYFRSLKELSYIVGLDEQKINWLAADAAEFTIIYRPWQNVERTYVPDFLVGTMVIEIKPTKLKSSRAVRLKQEAAEKFCQDKGWTYEIVDPPKISEATLSRLYDYNEIVFIKRYDELFRKRFYE